MVNKSLEKAIIQNQELRKKYQNDPLQFLDSETILLEAIQDCFTNEKFDYQLIQLLDHENTDISALVFDLINQTESIQVKKLIELGFIELLKFNINRFDREQIFTCLSIIETLLELEPDLDIILFDQFHSFLISNLKVEFDSVKQYCVELLGLLIQKSSENRLKCNVFVEPLLELIAFYKNKNPTEPLEIEMIENLFDCLCCLLLEKEIIDVFLKEQGIELMLLMLKNKAFRSSALKVLSFGIDNEKACSTFIEFSGLKYVFIGMKTNVKDNDEHILTIISCLLKYSTGQHQQRILFKFLDNDLLHIHAIMLKRLHYASLITGNDYVEKLDTGLIHVQMIDLILLFLMDWSEYLRKQIPLLLEELGFGIKNVLEGIQEYSDYLEDSKLISAVLVRVTRLLVQD